jgi:hypothetical protein
MDINKLVSFQQDINADIEKLIDMINGKEKMNDFLKRVINQTINYYHNNMRYASMTVSDDDDDVIISDEDINNKVDDIDYEAIFEGKVYANRNSNTDTSRYNLLHFDSNFSDEDESFEGLNLHRHANASPVVEYGDSSVDPVDYNEKEDENDNPNIISNNERKTIVTDIPESDMIVS